MYARSAQFARFKQGANTARDIPRIESPKAFADSGWTKKLLEEFTHNKKNPKLILGVLNLTIYHSQFKVSWAFVEWRSDMNEI